MFFKKRPALVLKTIPKYNDLLVCGISSQLNSAIEGLDIVVKSNTNEFRQTGLHKDSVFRISYILIIPLNFIEGKIGSITEGTYNLIIERLCCFLKPV